MTKPAWWTGLLLVRRMHDGVIEKVEVGKAVQMKAQRARQGRRSDILFLLLTVGPWVLMIWLLWPRC